MQILMDGRPLGTPTRALVRRGRRDLGRYHLWFDAWQFRDRASGKSTLWLVRRLQRHSGASPRYEVITVAEDGLHETRVLRGFELGGSYPLFRATQFVRDANLWSGVPLSVLDFVVLPPLLLFFPLGTLLLGLHWIRRGIQAAPGYVAA